MGFIVPWMQESKGYGRLRVAPLGGRSHGGKNLKRSFEPVEVRCASALQEAPHHQAAVIESVGARARAAGIVKNVERTSAQDGAMQVSVQITPREHDVP